MSLTPDTDTPAPAAAEGDLGAFAQEAVDAINSPTGQVVENAVVDALSGMPKWVRGLIYGGLGAAGTAAGSILSFAATNPNTLPEWLVIAASVSAAPLAAIVGSVGYANLGKK